MKQENFDYLAKQIQYMGFGDQHQKELEKAMKSGKEEFVLPITLSYASTGEKADVQYKLNFRKGNEDMYFLNSYHAAHNNMEAKFFVNHGEKNITSKEAFNLMEGRSVYRELSNKEGEKYSAWVKIDPESIGQEHIRFQTFNENYGYNLKAALNKVLDKQLYFAFNKDDVMKSLEKGNVVEVMAADKSQKYFVAADPQYKTMAIFDKDGNKLKLDDINKTESLSLNQKQGISMGM